MPPLPSAVNTWTPFSKDGQEFVVKRESIDVWSVVKPRLRRTEFEIRMVGLPDRFTVEVVNGEVRDGATMATWQDVYEKFL